MIHVDKLSKSFGALEAVKEVSFDVKPGELFGFLGPNGAGKTTTLKMLCTLLTPSSGQASVNGFDIVRQRDDVRRSLGITFQDPTLDERFSAIENLDFHAMIYKIPSKLKKQRIEEALALVDLADKADVIVKTFSGGMKRRLEIARCLIHRPAVIFLDEPTLGLDPQTRRRIWDFLGKLRAETGLTLLLTTHYMDEAEACDRIAIIDHGSIVVLDTPEHLKQQVAKDRIELHTAEPQRVVEELSKQFSLTSKVDDNVVSFEVDHGDEFVLRVIPALGTHIQSIQMRRPSLEDVFVKLTGHAIRDNEGEESKLRMVMRARK